MYLCLVDKGVLPIHKLSWTLMEHEVADWLKMKFVQGLKLRKQFFEDGDVLLFGKEFDDLSKRGDGSPNYVNPYTKLTPEDIQLLVNEVDERHEEGKTVTNQLVRNFLRETLQVQISNATIRRYFHLCGLT